MKNLGPILLALGAAGVAYYLMKNGMPQFTRPRTDNLLPSPGAFTEAPIFASDVQDSGIWT